MNRRQFIPMLLGTAFIDVSKLNFSKNDVYLKKKEIFSLFSDFKKIIDYKIFKLIVTNSTNPYTITELSKKLSINKISLNEFLIVGKNNYYKALIELNYNITNETKNIIDNYIFPQINSKDDLKHYYENIEILEQLNS